MDQKSYNKAITDIIKLIDDGLHELPKMCEECEICYITDVRTSLICLKQEIKNLYKEEVELMDGYWMVNLKVDATITELDFNKKCKHVNWEDESCWKFMTNKCADTIAIIPKENILYIEWRDK